MPQKMHPIKNRETTKTPEELRQIAEAILPLVRFRDLSFGDLKMIYGTVNVLLHINGSSPFSDEGTEL